MSESITAQFHNQRDGGFDPESGVIKSPSSKNFDDLLGEYDKEAESMEKQVQDVIKAINTVRLDSSFSKDQEQVQLLKQKKEDAKKMISIVLESIESYVMAIKSLEQMKENKESHDQKTFLQLKKNADSLRSTKHNVLISNIKSAIRFISHTFGDISPKAIEKWEEKAEESGDTILMVDRKSASFPAKVICPTSLNLNDRDQIASWAVKLYHSLSQLKKELS